MRRLLVAVVAVVGLVFNCASASSSDPAPQPQDRSEIVKPAPRYAQSPNIIVVLLDDARADDIDHMPIVQQQLIGQGVSFNRAYHNYPLCCPARAGFLRGQLAHNHTIVSNVDPDGGYRKWRDDGLYNDTLPVWLDDAGYHTIHIGKHLNQYGQFGNDGQPDPGWDVWRAISAGVGNTLAPTFSFDGDERVIRRHVTGTVNTLAERIIGHQADNPDRPFFMYVSHPAPHAAEPHEPDDPEGWPTPYVWEGDRNTSTVPEPQRPSFNEADMSDKPSFRRDRPLVDAAAEREVRRQRIESLQSVDRGVGRIINKLDDIGELDSTYLMFWSDNGWMLGEHRNATGKHVAYTESARAPLMIRGPGIPTGIQRNQMVSASADVTATILDLTNTWDRPGHPIDGRTVLPFIEDSTIGMDRAVLLQHGGTGRPWNYRGVRNVWGMYVEYQNGEEELYRNDIDRWQLDSLHDDPDYAAQKANMQVKLAMLRDCVGVACRML